MLAWSQFVLCPPGDYVWSYRFFEACLCGAIPIIHDVAPVYEGFQYLRLGHDDLAACSRSVEAAQHNLRRATELLTAPRDILSSAIERNAL
jgi:hypothetical protein